MNGSRVATIAFAAICLLSIPGHAAHADATSDTVGAAGPDTSKVVAVRSGSATIVDAGSRSSALSHGGSALQFAMKLPEGATCPGDSQFDQWRVQTFVIPENDDPATLNYTIEGPDGAHQFAIWGADYTAVINEFTVPNEKAGQRARIDLKPMSFGVFQPGSLPNGTYKMGVACTYFGKTGDYWDTKIVITNDPADKPAQLTWRLDGSPTTATSAAAKSGTNTGLVVVIVVAAFLAALVVVVIARRAKASHPRPRSSTHLDSRSHP